MKANYLHSLKSELFDSETAYKVASKVIRDFFSRVSSKYVKAYEIPDIIQEAVVRAYSYSYSFNPANGKFSGWIGMIAWRVADDYYAKRKKTMCEIEFTDNDRENADFFNPEKALLFKEQEDSIFQFKQSLNPLDKQCLELMEDGMKPRDIAKEMNCTPDAAATRAFRIRKRIESQKFR